jgi:sugar/nucleoside kinase (ribokinase family)
VSTGSILVDLVLDLPALPERGGDVLADQVLMAAGGGMNIVAAASRLGLPSVYAGPHGTGPFGDRVRAALAAEGVPPLIPAAAGQDTGYCITMVDAGGERTFVTVGGADAVVTSADLEAVRPDRHDAVYVSGYDLAYPDSHEAVGTWVAGLPDGPLVVVDPGPLVADISEDVWQRVLPRTDVLTLNEREAAQEPVLRRHLRDSCVVVRRLGADGALLDRPGAAPTHVPGVPVTVVDTTGAGDTHTGALLAALAHGLAWPDALELANHAAAFSVTVRGGVAAPTLAQLRAFWGHAAL